MHGVTGATNPLEVFHAKLTLEEGAQLAVTVVLGKLRVGASASTTAAMSSYPLARMMTLASTPSASAPTVAVTASSPERCTTTSLYSPSSRP